MTPDVRAIVYPWKRSADQSRAQPAEHAIVIVGAGPVGLVAALDLAQKGHRCVVLDRKSNLSDGSRAICWAKRTLEIMDRLGVGQALVDKGVTWKNGKVFFDEREVFAFDLLPEEGHRRPAFINLQQYYFEHACIEAAERTGLIDIRWQEDVQGLEQTGDGVLLTIGTPEGSYRLMAQWVLAADGARSTVRQLLGLDFEGRVFRDQFLICDIRMKMERPVERWFWFDPPFNRGRSALLHKQADNVWRLDFQVGEEADREEEMKPANVARRVRAMLGEDVEFAFEWISLYRFQSRRLQTFPRGPRAVCREMPRTRCRRSARAGATAASRTPTTSPGSSTSSCAGWRRSGCWTAMTASASRRRTRTCCTLPAPPISSRRKAVSAGRFAMPPWRWPRPSRSRAG